MAAILVVEDESDVRELVMLHLKRQDLTAVGVVDGEKALEELARRQFDLVVLDWMLPGISGLEICRRVAGRVPILMVTARAETADIISGLEAGADDYITKPFEIPVFLARVNALLRRQLRSNGQTATTLQVGQLVIDCEKHEVNIASQPVPLTISEFRLLSSLLSNKGKVISRLQLVGMVQGTGVNVTGRTIDTHVFGLRKKLGRYGDLVETIRGVGYRVKDSELEINV